MLTCRRDNQCRSLNPIAFISNHIMFMANRTYILLVVVLPAMSMNAAGQTEASIPVCKQRVFAAARPLPKLKYSCGGQANDYGARILERPDRVRAIKRLSRDWNRLSARRGAKRMWTI